MILAHTLKTIIHRHFKWWTMSMSQWARTIWTVLATQYIKKRLRKIRHKLLQITRWCPFVTGMKNFHPKLPVYMIMLFPTKNSWQKIDVNTSNNPILWTRCRDIACPPKIFWKYRLPPTSNSWENLCTSFLHGYMISQMS